MIGRRSTPWSPVFHRGAHLAEEEVLGSGRSAARKVIPPTTPSPRHARSASSPGERESMLAATVADIDHAGRSDPGRLRDLRGLASYQQGLALVKKRASTSQRSLSKRAPVLARASSRLPLGRFHPRPLRLPESGLRRRPEEGRGLLRRLDTPGSRPAARTAGSSARPRWARQAGGGSRFLPVRSRPFERTRESVTRQPSIPARQCLHEIGDARSAWQHRARPCAASAIPRSRPPAHRSHQRAFPRSTQDTACRPCCRRVVQSPAGRRSERLANSRLNRRHPGPRAARRSRSD